MRTSTQERRRLVREWLLSGKPGTQVALTQALTNKGYPCSPPMVSKDIRINEAEWTRQSETRRSRAFHVARLERLVGEYENLLRSTTHPLHRIAALNGLRGILKEIALIDGAYEPLSQATPMEPPQTLADLAQFVAGLLVEVRQGERDPVALASIGPEGAQR